jgi:hypothetical protein
MNKIICILAVLVALSGCKRSADKAFQAQAIAKGQAAFQKFFGGEMTVANTRVVSAGEFKAWWKDNNARMPRARDLCDIKFVINGGVRDPSPIALDVTDALKTKSRDRVMYIVFPDQTDCKHGTLAGFFAQPSECEDDTRVKCNGGVSDHEGTDQTCQKTCYCAEQCGGEDIPCTECP